MIKDHPGLQVVGEAGTLDKCIEIVTLLKPDIILFEFNLSDQPKLDFISRLIEACPDTGLILRTGITDPLIIQQAVVAGVMGVVLKTQTVETLIKAIEKENSRDIWLERSMVACVVSHLSRNISPINPNSDQDNLNQLSEGEIEVVRLIGLGFKK